MFVKVGNEVFNTRHVIRARFGNNVCAVTLAEGGNDGSIGYTRYFDGDDGKALWDYLCSPVLCTDVLAGQPAPVRP